MPQPQPPCVAKPALGKGLGELLSSSGTSAPHSVTAAHTAAESRLSAGMSTLVGRPVEPLPIATHMPSPVVLRSSLLVADVALTGGAVLYSQVHSPLGWMATVFVLTAVALGAWLGWLGLSVGRDRSP